VRLYDSTTSSAAINFNKNKLNAFLQTSSTAPPKLHTHANRIALENTSLTSA
jgi:hypothetical protein